MAIPDYSLGMVQPSQVGQSFSQGLQNGVALGEAAQQSQDRALLLKKQAEADALAKEKLAADAAAKAQQQADFIEVAKAPTTQKISRLIVQYPSMSEQLKRSYDVLDGQEQAAYQSLAQRAYAAASGGNHDTASKILNEAAVAYRNSGMEDRAKALEENARLIKENPNVATMTLGGFLASTMGPKEFEKTFETAAALPSNVQKKQAEADKAIVEAKFAERKALADIGLTEKQAARYEAQTNIEWARLKLDREKAAREALDALRKRVDDATKLTPDAFKLISDAGGSAVASRMVADEADTLAAALIANPAGGGKLGTWAEAIKAATGSEDDLTALRTRFSALKAKGIYLALGKGTKTDDDYAQFAKGFPPDSAGSEAKASFLRGMAKAARFTAATEDAQADYVSRNGAPSNAKTDLVIGGVTIPAGTTYSNAIAMVQAAERQKDTAAKARATASNAIADGFNQ